MKLPECKCEGTGTILASSPDGASVPPYAPGTWPMYCPGCLFDPTPTPLPDKYRVKEDSHA